MCVNDWHVCLGVRCDHDEFSERGVAGWTMDVSETSLGIGHVGGGRQCMLFQETNVCALHDDIWRYHRRRRLTENIVI